MLLILILTKTEKIKRKNKKFIDIRGLQRTALNCSIKPKIM